MGRTTVRDAADTRSLVLQAASELFLQHGASASLDHVAALAGLSKGGLKYHFNTKEELIGAVAQFQADAFRSEVALHFNDQDRRPGRLVRAYIKACLNPDVQGSASRAKHSIFVLLSSCPLVQEIWQQDERWWQRSLEADGLDRDLRDVVLAAAEGAASAPTWTYTRARTSRLRNYLLELTNPALRDPIGHPLVSPAISDSHV